MTAGNAPISVIGVSHRTCPDSLRERLYVDDSEVAAVIGTLRIRGVREAIVLSTCDRVEVTAVFRDGDLAPMTVATALGGPIGLRGEQLIPYLYRHDGNDAVRHVFRVASALDSQIVGEPQVLGQVKAAQRLSKDLNADGPAIDRILQAAYAIAKRVRTETRIGEGAVSLATAAVARVHDLHGDLDGRTALVIGGDELSLMIARQLRAAGLRDLTVLDLFRKRAAVTAAELEAHHGSLDDLAAALDRADVVIAGLGIGRYLITAEMMQAVLRRRRRRPVFLLDLAVPGDIEPAVHRLDEAYVYDVADLERVTHEGRAGREAEAAKAEALVESAVVGFDHLLSVRDAGPDIARLRAHVEAQALAAAGDGPEAAAIARRIAGRLLHAPSEALRHRAAAGQLDDDVWALINEVFGMDGGPKGDDT
ncbi:Glutamyl-tRNA reductase [alpha proteobacterium BAL199]|jgi:glutamyl-tRNA reductase|nr:Glutamyl-tRNA reductase [alpha proteobacterium BAL199]